MRWKGSEEKSRQIDVLTVAAGSFVYISLHGRTYTEKSLDTEIQILNWVDVSFLGDQSLNQEKPLTEKASFVWIQP